MRLRNFVEFAALLLSISVLAGCSTTRPKKAESSTAAAETKDDYSAEASERRAEAHARYANAILYDINEESEKAAEEFYQAALTDPTDEDLVLEASQRLLQLKDNDKAQEILLKATRQKDAPGILFAQLGRIYALQGKKELAVEADRAAIRKVPDSMMGYRNLAQLYLQGNQIEQGLKVLEDAAKRRNPDAAFLVELAELYTAYGRINTDIAAKADGVGRTGPGPFGGATTNIAVKTKAQALEALNRAAKQKPTNPLLMKKLADGFVSLGEPEKATEIYLKLVELFPRLPGLREKLTELYLRKEDRKKAAEQLQQLVRNNPTNPQLYYLLGSIFYEEKDPTNAIEYFNKTILLNADFEPAYYDLAGAQINANDPKSALSTLEKARDKFQESFVGEFFTALAFNRMKDYTNAIKHLTSAEMIARVTDTNKLSHLFYFQLGAAFERSHNIKEAEKNFRKCLSLQPDFAEGLNYLGYMWAERGEHLSEARGMIEKAVKLEPKNAAYLDSLGWVLYKMGKPDEALESLLKAVQYSEEPDATLFDHLGDIYLAAHQEEKAREAWKKSLKIEPNEQIQKKLSEGAAAHAPSAPN